VADEQLETRPVERAFMLDDLHVRSDGGGRTVEAYAAVFNTRTEVIDQDGHYDEELTPTSFDRTINARGPSGFGVLFNHGRTIDGSPNPLATLPIGVPLEVRADGRGVYTATRYLDNPLADQVLDAIKSGAIRAQSFSGRFTKSTRARAARGNRPVITRQEVDMREYGPAVFAAYPTAAILGTRAEMFVRSLLAVPPQDRLQWLQQFEGLTTLDTDPGALTPGTPSSGPAATADDSREHSARSNALRARIRAARRDRGI
jgi:HK97 family phage prohead protease